LQKKAEKVFSEEREIGLLFERETRERRLLQLLFSLNIPTSSVHHLESKLFKVHGNIL
jgi:hypothetical protein